MDERVFRRSKKKREQEPNPRSWWQRGVFMSEKEKRKIVSMLPAFIRSMSVPNFQKFAQEALWATNLTFEEIKSGLVEYGMDEKTAEMYAEYGKKDWSQMTRTRLKEMVKEAVEKRLEETKKENKDES